MAVGIESINAYVGRTSLGVRRLFEARGLQLQRFGNLMMDSKSVALPCEDPVTNGVNAAKPLIDEMTAAQRDRIELIVVGTESGLDFGKPISTYIHDYLGLSRRCRSFEVKHACYGGTAALRTAAGIIADNPGATALVIAADAAMAAAKDTYWEPSQGTGAVAMIVGHQPEVFELDRGASGFYSHDVMDTLRPRPDIEAGDSDLSLLSYLNCLDQSFEMYSERVAGVDIADSFQHLVFHTPFAGMVKGAHRQLLRKRKRLDPAAIEADFDTRTEPSLRYCRQIGNIYGAALYLALCSLIDHVAIDGPRRAGMFSYGSGCASEFYSGVIGARAKQHLARRRLGQAIADRYELDFEEYETISDLAFHRMCGVQDHVYDTGPYEAVYKNQFAGRGLLVLDRVENFHRIYRWS